MKALLLENEKKIIANCSYCNGKNNAFQEVGQISNKSLRHVVNDIVYDSILFKSYACTGCGRGAIAQIHIGSRGLYLGDFYPPDFDFREIPKTVPEGIIKEFREAEQCLAYNCKRAAAAMFASTLEKVLKQNGYSKEEGLKGKLLAAYNENMLTQALWDETDKGIRTLRNEVLHDEKRIEIGDEEIEDTHKFTKDVIDAFYRRRETVIKLLKELERLDEDYEEKPIEDKEFKSVSVYSGLIR